MNKNTEFNNYSNFIKQHEQPCGGYKTMDLARESMDLKYKWWGSNLVLLGIREQNGLFYPSYNVFD